MQEGLREVGASSCCFEAIHNQTERAGKPQSDVLADVYFVSLIFAPQVMNPSQFARALPNSVNKSTPHVSSTSVFFYLSILDSLDSSAKSSIGIAYDWLIISGGRVRKELGCGQWYGMNFESTLERQTQTG